MNPILEGVPVERVRAYHQRSKHGFEAYAKGPGLMDWATQPEPFHRYKGAPCLELRLTADRCEVPYRDLFRPSALSEQPFTRGNVALLLELSFGLSAWKGYAGDRWALRCNPSSGNLHPTETYLATGEGVGLEGSVYHYVSHDHALEHGGGAAAVPDPDTLISAACAGAWRGRANVLSRRHLHHWPVIDEVHAAAEKPRSGAGPVELKPADLLFSGAGAGAGEFFGHPPKLAPLLPTPCELSAPELIRGRRSAQAFDGVTAINAAAFFREPCCAVRTRSAVPRPVA